MGVDDLLSQFGLGDDDRAAWERSGRDDLEQWLTDRVARQPRGARARRIYGAADVHDFARRAILDALALTADDRLLEIGCGGGLLLKEARAGSRTGIDHSPDMVAIARENAPEAEIVRASADDLPFPDHAFTAIAMSVVFLFFDDPDTVLAECRRVLQPGGRLAFYTTGRELLGTPAAPEPLASHTHLYADDELQALVANAGFEDVELASDGGGQLVTARR